MINQKMRMVNCTAAQAAMVMAIAVAPSLTQGQCVEPSCTILQTYQGPPGSTFGWGVSEIADIDDDGAMDFITGDPTDGTGGSAAGMAVVYSSKRSMQPLWTVFGNPNESLGFAIADAGLVGPDFKRGVMVGGQSTNGLLPGKVVVYCAITGCELFTITGEAIGDRFGHSVKSAGDVNDDGRDDILVGALTNDHLGNNSGRAYIFSGLDGSLIRHLNAESAGSQFGSGVSGIGDVNNDGIPDQAIAARAAVHAAGIGKVYVFSGKDGSPLWQKSSSAGASQFGQFFVAGAGDVNRDGQPDVYIGDFGHNTNQGRLYVYSGPTGDILHEIAGVPGEGLGPGRGAGDVNGDGYADLIAGGWTSNAGAPGGGKVYVYSGRDGSVLRTITSTVASEQRGFDAVGIGDVNGDRKLDFLISAAAAGRVYIFAGDIAPLPPGDINGDGVVGVPDLLAVIGAWGPCPQKCPPSCPSDVAPAGGDCIVGVPDLLFIISHWSAP